MQKVHRTIPVQQSAIGENRLRLSFTQNQERSDYLCQRKNYRRPSRNVMPNWNAHRSSYTPRRGKLHIIRFAASGKTHSFCCPSSPHKVLQLCGDPMRCRALCRGLVGAWKFPRTHIGGLHRTGKTAFSLQQLALSTLLRPPRNRTPCCGKLFRFMGLNHEDRR